MKPLLKIFDPAVETDPEMAAWKAASQALFIRWALEAKKPPQREALWELVRQSSSDPVTEALVKDCFGQTPEQIWAQLDRFLGLAVRRSGELRVVAPAPRVNVTPREATPLEIAEIMGDWHRLEADYLANDSVYRPRYLEAARKAVGKIEKPASSPALTLVRGIIEVSAENGALASELLEQVLQGDDVAAFRPAAGYHLTRLRLTSVLGAGANLTEREARFVLLPLERVRDLPPVMPQGAFLFSKVWWHCETLPADAQQVLQDYARLFPTNELLVLQIAEVFERHGIYDVGARLAGQGLRSALDERVRERLTTVLRRCESEKKRAERRPRTASFSRSHE